MPARPTCAKGRPPTHLSRLSLHSCLSPSSRDCRGPHLRPSPLTSLEVGLPRKNSWLRELWGGLKRDCRKTQPLAMASRGAGPS